MAAALHAAEAVCHTHQQPLLPHLCQQLLRVRSIAVPEAVRERIQAEKDVERLERWVEKAAVAATIAEVIDEAS